MKELNSIEPFRKSVLSIAHVVVALRTVQYLGRIVLNNSMYCYNSTGDAGWADGVQVITVIDHQLAIKVNFKTDAPGT